MSAFDPRVAVTRGSVADGFRTPALSKPGQVTTGRHPKPLTTPDVRRDEQTRSERCQKLAYPRFSPDLLVDAGQQHRRDFEAERPGRWQADDKLELARLH